MRGHQLSRSRRRFSLHVSLTPQPVANQRTCRGVLTLEGALPGHLHLLSCRLTAHHGASGLQVLKDRCPCAQHQSGANQCPEDGACGCPGTAQPWHFSSAGAFTRDARLLEGGQAGPRCLAEVQALVHVPALGAAAGAGRPPRPFPGACQAVRKGLGWGGRQLPQGCTLLGQVLA